MNKFILISVVLFLTSCGATGPKFTTLTNTESGYGVIYIYRPSAFLNGGAAPYVYINGEEKSKLKNGGYQLYKLPPGEYEVVTDGFTWLPGKAVVVVKLNSAEKVYLRLVSNFEAAIGTSIVSGSTLTPVTEKFALKELVGTKLSM